MSTTNNEDVKINISDLEAQMKKLPSRSSKPCIFTVPKRLRKVNPEAYTPQVVSIGPFHHGRKELEAMEEHKLWYLNDFIQRSKWSLEDLMQYVKGKESEVRDCYSETISLPSNEFNKMVLVDAAFVVGFIIRFRGMMMTSDDDPIFSIRPYLLEDIGQDLVFLLENQLPPFIIQGLATNIIGDDKGRFICLDFASTCIMRRFVGEELMELTYETIKDSSGTCHFVQMLSLCFQPSVEVEDSSGTCKAPNIPSAVRQHQAGIEFKVKQDAANRTIPGFTFSKSGGVLEIPSLEINNDTAKIFRNIIAFEQCCGTQTNLTNYIILLQKLVNTTKDAELLLEKKAINSGIGGPEEVAKAGRERYLLL